MVSEMKIKKNPNGIMGSVEQRARRYLRDKKRERTKGTGKLRGKFFVGQGFNPTLLRDFEAHMKEKGGLAAEVVKDSKKKGLKKRNHLRKKLFNVYLQNIKQNYRRNAGETLQNMDGLLGSLNAMAGANVDPEELRREKERLEMSGVSSEQKERVE
jgi:hypothetical protein